MIVEDLSVDQPIIAVKLTRFEAGIVLRLLGRTSRAEQRDCLQRPMHTGEKHLTADQLDRGVDVLSELYHTLKNRVGDEG